MNHFTRTGMASLIAACVLGTVAPAAFAAGPQPLPDAACNDGTRNAGTKAPQQTSAEAVPHIEHAFPVPVTYCHHFNPTASPPAP